MVYVYEGIEPEAPEGKRHRLIHPHYFCGVYDGKDNDKLWQEVYDYLDETYDLTKGKKVFLNADGGSWIQGAKKRLHGLTRVLDEFHLNKYLLRMTDRWPSGQCRRCRTGTGVSDQTWYAGGIWACNRAYPVRNRISKCAGTYR